MGLYVCVCVLSIGTAVGVAIALCGLIMFASYTSGGHINPALVQGVSYYSNHECDNIMQPDIGGFKPSEIEV